MRKKGIPEVKSLYEGAKIRIRVDSEMSQEFEVEVGIHQRSVLSPFFHFEVEADVVTELDRWCAM